MESKINLPPQDLPDDLEDVSCLQSIEYQTVRVKGHFLHAKELKIGPR
jgi:cytochrome oxidase assembly protein ShyY1